MTDIAPDEIQTGLTSILNELHSGLFGQREVWEKCLQAAISRLAAPPPEEIAGLIEDLISQGQRLHDQCPEETLQWRVAAALRLLAQELERTKDDLRRVQSVYDFAALTAERDALAQEVERQMQRALRVEAHLKDSIAAGESYGAEHDRDHQRIRELEGELATWKDISVTIEKARAAIRAKTIEECKKAIVNVRFGAPSNWGGDRPRGWHLNRPCTPEEASHHDNGCNDAFMAVSAIGNL